MFESPETSEIPKEIFQTLIETARKSPMHYKHAAGIVYKGNLICKGYNQSLRKGISSKHAERVVCSKIPKGIDPAECTLVVLRVTKTGLGNSKPCRRCTHLINKVGIGTVIHS